MYPMRLASVMPRLLLGSVLCLPASSATLMFSGSGGVIPDPGVFSSDIIVTDLRDLLSFGNPVTVTLLGLDHSWAGDLEVTLTYSGIGSVTQYVFSRIGAAGPGDFGASANFGDPTGRYSFNSGFAGDLWTVAGALGDADLIPSGDYWPTDPFSPAPNSLSSAFNGLPAAGTWTLTISDLAAGETGQYIAWDLTLEVVDVPEPATAPVMLAALAAFLIRLRILASHRPPAPLKSRGAGALARAGPPGPAWRDQGGTLRSRRTAQGPPHGFHFHWWAAGP